MNKTVVIGVILLLIVFSGFIFISNKNEESKPTSDQAQSVDKRASFAIFTNGTFRVFSAAMYHNLSRDVYIEAKNPNVIQIRKDSITWNDFFKTLPFSITKDCLTTGTKETFCTNQNGTLKFYLNGVRYNDLLDKEISNEDRALITYGSESEKQIRQQIDKLNTLNNN